MFAVQLQQIGDIEVGSTRRDRKDSKQWSFFPTLSFEGAVLID